MPGDSWHFLPTPPAPMGPARSPFSELPFATRTSASASGDDGSDTYWVSTICGREKGLLPGS